jgi:putative glutamine amidotransferase
MTRKPRIAVILDENTSGDASRYEASKGLFSAIRDAGGLPFGIPYLPEMVDVVVEEFDGVVCGGGRFAYPDDWYVGGEVSKAPPSDRLAVERGIVEAYLARDRPVLGICAGMQLLACVNGCRLWSDVQTSLPRVLEHDKRGHLHRVTLSPNSRLAALVGAPAMLVNTLHREAIGELSPAVVASAHSDDGVIEAIEVPSRTFALGLQWHQELFAGTDHPGNRVFRGLIDACLDGTPPPASKAMPSTRMRGEVGTPRT